MEHIVSFPNLNIEITVREEAFSIGNFSIQWYGVLIGIGLLLAIVYGFASAKKMNIDDDKLMDVIIWGIIGGLIGARAYFIIFYPGNYFTGDTLMENIYRLFNTRGGGLGFYGGLIGALLFGGITAKIKKMNIASLFDQVALGFLIGQGIGRWGNFVNQEAFGAETDLPWGMLSDNTGGVTVHPCFLYESIFCLLGFILLHFFTRKLRRYDGQTFLLYIVWYGLIRFFVEPLRTDSLMIGPLKVSVLVSALLVLGGVVALIVFRNRTSLSGCGQKEIMELNNVEFGQIQKKKEEEKRRKEEEAKKHTILEDLGISEEDDNDDHDDELEENTDDFGESDSDDVDDESEQSILAQDKNDPDLESGEFDAGKDKEEPVQKTDESEEEEESKQQPED